MALNNKGKYMITKITTNTISPPQKKYSIQKQPSFGARFKPETITNTNIGSQLNGYIGNIQVRTPDGLTPILKVFKSAANNNEEYRVLDKANNLIGSIELKICKDDRTYYRPEGDTSHVFVKNLKNYSTPKTPYHNKKLQQYKDIGTRLMQIALKRSQEADCFGNIKLIAKGESKPFYEKIIGMQEEFPVGSPARRFNNPNTMYLPEESKGFLRNLQGGL